METRKCQNCHNDFVIEPEDFKFYEKMQVPPPTFCPMCRLQRRLAYRNERALYRRKCDLCGEIKIMSFSSAYEGPVYCPPCWWSDKWDAVRYAQEYDQSRPFLEQFLELRKKVPQAGLAVSFPTIINSDYCHMATDIKNSYLVTHSTTVENSFYSSALLKVKDSGELFSCEQCELCLEDVDCLQCYKTYFSLDCEQCHDVFFSYNCINCSNCFGCVNLRNQQYQIFNRQYTKEEYFHELEKLDTGSFRVLEETRLRMNEIRRNFPQKYIHGRHNVNVTGDYISNSKNSRNCYTISGVEDSKYCQYINAKPVANCYDYTEWGAGAELAYESINCGQGIANIKFGQQSWGSVRDTEYVSFCMGSSNLFGCSGLRNKQYCILNKQYPKEEYDKLRQHIIKDMNARPYIDKRGRAYRYGEFFPIETSFWGYNETTANEYFPLTEAEARAQGYEWTDIQAQRGIYKPTMKAEDLPDHIQDITENLIEEIISCRRCSQPYRITKQELDFYRNNVIAVPRICPECRYKERFSQRNSFRLYERKCQCGGYSSENDVYKNTATHFHGEDYCPNDFKTAFDPSGKNIIYCAECYQKEFI